MKSKFFILTFISFLALAGCKRTASSATSSEINRIVSLAPSSTEILFAIGAENQIAACTTYCDYPPAAADLPKVGGFSAKTLSLEAVLSYEPDFVYLTNKMHDFLIPALEEYGIKYYIAYGTSIAELKKEILEVSEITGHQAQGKKIAQEIEKSIESVKKIKDSPVVYWEVWNSPYMTAGNQSFIHDVITLAGGKNLFGDIEDSYPIISEESIIKRQPDVILIPLTSGIQIQDIKNRSGWNEIPAIKNNRIYIIDDNLYTRAGPRIGTCINQLNGLLAQ